MHDFLRRISHSAANRLRLLARSEDGFTIVEVVISAVVVFLIAGGVLTGIEASSRSAADLRHRSQATELAHQDQERLRGMSAAQLSGLNQTREVWLDGLNFTVTSSGEFLNSVSGGTACGSQTADYIRIVTTVDWGAANKRQPVVEQSIITPPIGGTLLVRAVDQNNDGLPGVSVTGTGPESLSASTDSSGCAVFAGIRVGSYTLAGSRSGYVDWDGNPSVSGSATATSADTATVNLKPLGAAAILQAGFTTRVNGTSYGGQLAPSVSWFNSGMAVSRTKAASSPNGSATIDTGAAPSAVYLFPFTNGGRNVYTNNYAVWGGSCDGANPANDTPPDPNVSYATVTPGSVSSGTARLPALKIDVSYQTLLNTSPERPDNIKISGGPCNEQWQPPVRTPRDTSSPLGQLQFPGQPYAPSSRPYTVCVDYDADGPGPGPPYRATTTTPNTDFVNGTSVPMIIDSTSSANRGRCP